MQKFRLKEKKYIKILKRKTREVNLKQKFLNNLVH